MNLFPEPAQNHPKITRRDAFVEVGNDLPKGDPKLSPVDVSESIRREITNQTRCPVGILEHSLSIVGWCEAEILSVQVIPQCRQIGPVDPGRQTHVSRTEARRERMGREILPAGVEVEPHLPQDELGVLKLSRYVKWSLDGGPTPCPR